MAGGTNNSNSNNNRNSSNSNNSSNKIENKLDQLLNSSQIMLESMEKRGRENYPASMIRHFNSGKNYNQFLRERKSFNSTDFANLMNDVMNGLKRELSDLQKNFKDLSTKIQESSDELQNNTTLTQQQIVEKKKELDDLKKKKEVQAKQIDRLEKRIQGGSEREYERRHRVEKWQEGRKFDSSTPEMQKMFGNSRNQIRYGVNNANYSGESANRAEALRMIAESGLSNTGFGRFTQKLIERQQKIADIGNFGDKMANGGAEILSSAMFGNGKMASAAAKGLGAFGGALSSVTKALGPVGLVVGVAIDAFGKIAKAIGAAINAINAATTQLYMGQAQINEINHERLKQIELSNIEMKTEGVRYQGDLQLKMLDTQGQIMLNALKLSSEQYVKSVEVAIGPLTDGINATAYKAANAGIDAVVQAQKNLRTQSLLESSYGRYAKQRGLEYENAKIKTKSDIDLLNVNTEYRIAEAALNKNLFDAQHWFSSAFADYESFDRDQKKVTDAYRGSPYFNRSIEAEAKKLPKKVGGVNLEGLEWYETLLADAGGTWDSRNTLAQSAFKLFAQKDLLPADFKNALTKANADLQQTIGSYMQQIGDKQAEIQTEAANAVIDAAAEVKKMWLQLAQKNEEFLDKFDEVTNDVGISLGYTNRGQLNGYQQSMFEIAKNVGASFGKGIDEVIKSQSGYIEATGRNQIFDRHDYGQMLGLGKYLNDDSLAASYASEMEIFNAGVADSVDMLDKVLQDVNKIGLNGRKYTKTLVDSLKLAQKYNFKGGTANLMKMAKWAENTRFNMNSLSSMLDKISEGGLEGVITQGAQFQVLGGHAAMNADPIAMMFERYADPEALMKRYQDMTKGYGSLDRRTGETKFSGTEQMLMEQLAKIQGRSVEEVMNEVRARNKKEVVSRQLNGIFGEDEQSLISNLATYNKKTGQFEVKVKGKNGQYAVKDVNQLTKDDLDNLMPEQHNERMEDYMQTVITYLGKLTGEEIREKVDLGEATRGDYIKNYEERLKIAMESYAQNRDEYIAQTKQGMDDATAAFSDYIKVFEEGNDDVKAAVSKINSMAKEISSALGQTAGIIRSANAAIASNSRGVGVGDFTPYQGDLANGNTSTEVNQAKAKSRAKVRGNATNIMTNLLYPFSITAGSLMNTFFNTDIKDGVINNNNNPIMAQANKITKVQDGMGSFVQSDPKDTALFAKDGGPFDTLFNGVFSKINSLYDAYSGHQSASFNTNNGALKVEINGRLELSSGGQSVNIINEIQNNPLLIRALSRMLSEQLSKAFNGGRGTSPIAIGNV